MQKVELDTILPQIMEMAITQDYLVVISNGVPYLYVYDKINGKLLTTYSAKGKGPHEFLRPQGIEALEGNHIQLYDIGKVKLFDLNIDQLLAGNISSLEKIVMDLKEKFPFNIKQLAQGRQISTGMYRQFYAIHEPNATIISEFSDYPIGSEVDSTAASFSFLGSLAVHPDGERFAYGTMRMGLIQIGQVDPKTGRGETTKNLDFQIAAVIDESKSNGRISSRISNDEPFGFPGLVINKSHIFALYSGKSVDEHKEDYGDCAHLLVLDWKGKPVKRFEISPEAKKLIIDHHRNILYFIAINQESLEDELFQIKIDNLNL